MPAFPALWFTSIWLNRMLNSLWVSSLSPTRPINQMHPWVCSSLWFHSTTMPSPVRLLLEILRSCSLSLSLQALSALLIVRYYKQRLMLSVSNTPPSLILRFEGMESFSRWRSASPSVSLSWIRVSQMLTPPRVPLSLLSSRVAPLQQWPPLEEFMFKIPSWMRLSFRSQASSFLL